MDRLLSILNRSELEIIQGLFLAFPGMAGIQRFQSSLDIDSMECDGRVLEQILLRDLYFYASGKRGSY